MADGVLGENSDASKSLKNMEPMSGLEPLTYALRMRWGRFWQVVEKT